MTTSRRDCVHEAGHFYVAFLHNPARAVSIRMSPRVQTDPITGEMYTCIGQAVTLDPIDDNPRVILRIRAGGLAAESIVYNESFQDLMSGPEVQFRIRTDTDNAKLDLERGRLTPTSEEEFISFFWSVGFQDAVAMMAHSQEKLECIADYCQLNLARDILREELVRNCRLW